MGPRLDPLLIEDATDVSPNDETSDSNGDVVGELSCINDVLDAKLPVEKGRGVPIPLGEVWILLEGLRRRGWSGLSDGVEELLHDLSGLSRLLLCKAKNLGSGLGRCVLLSDQAIIGGHLRCMLLVEHSLEGLSEFRRKSTREERRLG